VKIGNVEIKGYAALAPMAGVADTAFRTICREFGACYTVGELASAKGLCMSDRKTAELLTVSEAERPMAVQLFGGEVESMAKGAEIALKFNPDVIDINMGCPAPKVANNGGGSALLKNPILAGKIVEAVVKAVDIPVTVKIRKGWDKDHVNAVEVAHIAEESGASAVTIHGRTREDMYRPPADLEIIRAVKDAVKIPVIGNGDIFSPKQAKEMYDKTGVDLIMIGRASLGSPWIFTQVEEYLKTGVIPPAPSIEERMKTMCRHVKLVCDLKGEKRGMKEARKHAAWYMKGLDGASAFRSMTCNLTVYSDVEILAQAVIERNS
jgi:nifR3 family TIM-barrel protein